MNNQNLIQKHESNTRMKQDESDTVYLSTLISMKRIFYVRTMKMSSKSRIYFIRKSKMQVEVYFFETNILPIS